jgi:Lipopolysaccharide-assembly
LKRIQIFIILAASLCIFNYASCKYSFKDVSPIPVEVKNFRVQPLGNKAQYVNPQLSAQLTDKLRQKIINTTRLRQINEDDADYDISGYISDYTTTTVSIQNGQSGSNRLTVSFHLIFKNKLDNTKDFEADVSYNKDFESGLSLTDAENKFGNEIQRNLTDLIFNKIFSNW